MDKVVYRSQNHGCTTSEVQRNRRKYVTYAGLEIKVGHFSAQTYNIGTINKLADQATYIMVGNTLMKLDSTDFLLKEMVWQIVELQQ